MHKRAKFIRTPRQTGSTAWCGMSSTSTNNRRTSKSSMLHTKRSSIELKLPNQETSIAAHFLSVEQLMKIFDTDLNRGLSEVVARGRLQTDGPNALKQVQDLTLLKIFIHNLFGWFPMMLWVGSLLSIAIHFIQYLADSSHFSYENLYLGSIIIIVILFTGLFAFYQEAKNVQVMKGFKDLIPLTATVIREGILKTIPSHELVVGDIVEMSSGEMVPADVRLLEVSNLRIDMSSITGEAEPQSRNVYFTSENPLETKNLAFFSCIITDGQAKGIVVATGEQSVIGRIAGLASGVEKEETPIGMEIKHFLKILCALALIFGGIFFVMVSLIQSNWIAGFYYMTGIVVANVPEGLLVTLTIALTMTAKKLQHKNCLVKKLQSVETLGAMSCICSDKTGTLTQNRMTVSHMAYNLKIVSHEEDVVRSDKNFHDFARACCLCLRAKFVESDSSKTIDTQKIIGDASESAVLRYMEGKNAASHMRKVNPKVCEIPFNSKNKYQISIHSLENNTQYLLVMKGAPEIILDLCKTLLVSNENKKMTTREKNILRKMCTHLGQMGERVLGYCDFLLPDDEYPQGFQFNTEKINFPIRGFRFLGLISLIDPPRESVPGAIAKCRSAGIRVFMVTGDHPITALAISRKVGIISLKNDTPYDDAFKKDIDPKKFMESVDILNYNAAVITGDDLRTMTTENLDLLIESVEEITFARTTPQQKLLIVESCQRVGHVVGVTGDGVNDSPALKKADIGIAMGITGSDVSKQAADMILLDDDFSSIILGVEEGRLIFDNLKKCIAFTLTSNIPEMIPFLLYATLGIPLPLHALLIICINVLTDLWPAISLAYERSESDIMKKPPRDLYLDHLVTSNLICMAYFQIGVIQLMAAMTSYFVAMAVYGFFPSSLIFTRERWNSPAVNDFEDSFGQEWSFEERKYLETIAQSTYYATIVLVQIADLIICKTRRVSLRYQGMSNHMLNIGIIVELAISLVILYVPIFNQILYTAPIPWILWLPGLPYIFVIILTDELRRHLIRKYPKSWIVKELYY